MPRDARMLTHEQAKTFYDWMGIKQDWQAFYEAPATRDLIAHANFETAQAVFECGCGTGAFAEQLLSSFLPAGARYVTVDSSTTMVRLAKERLARFGDRVVVQQTEGTLRLDAPSGAFDRFVATYVVDLLSVSDITILLDEAHRLLAPEGYLCLVNLTRGTTLPARLVTGLWSRAHALRPALLGGCRPLQLLEFLPETLWQVAYTNLVTAFGVPSEIVIASKQPEK